MWKGRGWVGIWGGNVQIGKRSEKSRVRLKASLIVLFSVLYNIMEALVTAVIPCQVMRDVQCPMWSVGWSDTGIVRETGCRAWVVVWWVAPETWCRQP